MLRGFTAALAGGIAISLLGCSNTPPAKGMTQGTGLSAGTGASRPPVAGSTSITPRAGTGATLPPVAGSGGVVITAGSGAAAGSGGAVITAGSGGATAGGSAPTAGSGSPRGDDLDVIPPGPRTLPGYTNLAPELGEPLDGKGNDLTPAAPANWVWYNIDGAVCRDGSPTGFFVHTGTVKKLVIYLEGGGACSNGPFCNFNPKNKDFVLAGDGQVVIGTAAGTGPGRQQPGVYTDGSHTAAGAGIFDFSNAKNPFKDWSEVYVPYCTGDVHFGTKKDGMVPGLDEPQQFVGYLNMKLFISRIVPTFSDSQHVILTGASAGGFGAALNYSMVQDAFGEVPVDVIDDSGPPFDDKFMPVCMQKRWRESWGLNDSLPPDCADCKQEDGGGLLKLADFLLKKHPNTRIAMISTMQDEVIRLFYSVGLQDCASYDTVDPVGITVGQIVPNTYFPGDQYTMGVLDLRAHYLDTNRFSTFYMGGANPNFHQHVFRPEFYDLMINGTTQDAFVRDFLANKIVQAGP